MIEWTSGVGQKILLQHRLRLLLVIRLHPKTSGTDSATLLLIVADSVQRT